MNNKEQKQYLVTVFLSKDYEVKFVTERSSFGRRFIRCEQLGKDDTIRSYVPTSFISDSIREVIRNQMITEAKAELLLFKDDFPEYFKGENSEYSKFGIDQLARASLGLECDQKIRHSYDNKLISKDSWMVYPRENHVSPNESFKEAKTSKKAVILPIMDINNLKIKRENDTGYIRGNYLSNRIKPGDKLRAKVLRYFNPFTQKMIYCGCSLNDTLYTYPEKEQITKRKSYSRREVLGSNIEEKKITAYNDYYDMEMRVIGGINRFIIKHTRSCKIVPRREKAKKRFQSGIVTEDIYKIENIVLRAIGDKMQDLMPNYNESVMSVRCSFHYPTRRYSCAINKSKARTSANLTCILNQIKGARGWKPVIKRIRKEIIDTGIMKKKNTLLKDKDPEIKYLGEYLQQLTKGGRNVR